MTAGTSYHRIVLTGASGMLGQAIIKQLAGRNDVAVLALYRNDPPKSDLTNTHVAMVDLARPGDLTMLLKDFEPTVFIHTAATGMQLPRPKTEALTDINTWMPVRLAEVVAGIDHCSFVHLSSGLAYTDQGRPLRETDPLDTKHPYGASKAEAEKQLQVTARQRGLRLTLVRPFSFTGEGDFGTRLFPSLLHHALEQTRFEMSAGNQVRDHSSVDDIAAGVMSAALGPLETQATQAYNLGTGDTRTLRELVTSVIDQLGLNVDVEFGARPPAMNEPMFMVPDMTHTRKTLGWQARENVAHAVWRLAQRSFPSLVTKEPARYL